MAGFNGHSLPWLNGSDRQKQSANNSHAEYNDSEEQRCRNCHSAALHNDWRQGDRVCTNCGVVAESHLMDTQPEWREFNDAEDLVKGLPAAARCGMVPVDETKYLGGLQPTSLSSQPFGGEASSSAPGYGEAQIRKRLRATNRKLDFMMEKIHSKALNAARVHFKAKKKNGGVEGDENSENEGEAYPEYDHLMLQEEEDAHRIHAALYSEKWSLQRAILLHGAAHEQTTSSLDNGDGASEDREQLLSKMDSTLRNASKDMYSAYSMLLQAAQRLHLPERVINESTNRLCQYVTRRDGFAVRGVSSRLSKSTKTNNAAQRKEAAERLRLHNKMKQMGSIGAAILFLTARSLGWGRSLLEVCSSFEPHEPIAASSSSSTSSKEGFVKAKHCSKAMSEIKATFPSYARTVRDNHNHHYDQQHQQQQLDQETEISETINFTDHSLRRLQLPPVAEASVRHLLIHCRQEQVKLGENSGTKLSTLCAAVAYFVCVAGSVMQRLAEQAKAKTDEKKSDSKALATSVVSLKKRPRLRFSEKIARKRFRPSDMNHYFKTDPSIESKKVSFKDAIDKLDDSEDNEVDLPNFAGGDNTDDDDDEEDETPFDVFSHPPIQEDLSEKHEYEMRRMWDAWVEQMPWHRNIGEVEQSCGVSRNVILEFYKSKLYPRREFLLKVLGGGVAKNTTTVASGSTDSTSNSANNINSLQETPLAPILLERISTAAPLMRSKGKR